MPLLPPALNGAVAVATDVLRMITTTKGLQQILARNAADPAAAYCRFTYGPERARSWSRRRG